MSRKFLNAVKNIAILLLLSALTLYISQNFYQINFIHGESMYPTYKNMQFTLIDKKNRNFSNGDVIVFYCPALDTLMVKRIIASPCDNIYINEGAVFVNDIQSPYVCGAVSNGGIAKTPFQIPEHQYFVMGDNYEKSKDSRYEEIGCVSHENIIGKVIPNRARRECASTRSIFTP